MELEQILKAMDDFLEEAPEGCLKYQIKRNRIYYYHQIKSKNLEKPMLTYIKKGNIEFAHKLAQKGYFTDLRLAIQRELCLLKKFEEQYCPEEKSLVYSNLCDVRKELLKPLFIEAKEQVKKWMEEPPIIYEAHAENLKFKTDGGEMVRSKSELILANMFYKYKDTILYKYEYPLELLEYGRKITVHPDFTLLNIQTGEITYWEHAGRMDDARYADKFVRKVNLYISNNIIPGENLIITYESYTNPLDVTNAKKLLEQLW